MKKALFFLFVILTLSILLSFTMSCASAPEPEEEPPVEEPVEEKEEEKVTEKPEEKPVEEPDKPEPVSDQEMRTAMNAIEKAKQASADIYAAEEYEKALSAYAAARDSRESDPDRARELLASAESFAESAFETSAEKQYQDYLRRYAAIEKKLYEIDADKFEPEKTTRLLQAAEKVNDLYKREEFLEARDSARKALEGLSQFHQELDEKIRWAKILKRDTEAYLDDSEEAEAFIWAPEELQQATVEYTQGLEAYRRYQLEKSTEHFSNAKGLAMTAVRESPKRKAQYQTQALMDETAKEIEEASSLTVVTEDGNVIKPEEWKADEAEREAKEEADMEGKNQSRLFGIPEKSFIPLPVQGITVVLADESVDTLLKQAKDLWKRGVKEREKGNYSKAMEYFEEAGRLANQYKSMAGGDVYVVRGGQTPPESLWWISEMEYGSPFYWPIVWIENKSLIKDPDNIFPGWEIYLPVWQKKMK